MWVGGSLGEVGVATLDQGWETSKLVLETRRMCALFRFSIPGRLNKFLYSLDGYSMSREAIETMKAMVPSLAELMKAR